MIKASKFVGDKVLVQLRQPVIIAQDSQEGPIPSHMQVDKGPVHILQAPFITGIVEENATTLAQSTKEQEERDALWTIRYMTPSGQTARLTILADAIFAVTTISSIKVASLSS